MDGGTTSNHETGRAETPTGTRPGEWPTKVQPTPLNSVEKAKAEMKWMEDIQEVLKKVEDLQKELLAANIDDELVSIAEGLRKKMAVRKANFEKYFFQIGKEDDSGM